MSVVGLAAVQSLEELHRVVSTAVIQRRAIAAVYDEARRLFCPHVLGYNDPGEYRVFCYQYGGESRHGPPPNAARGIWRCIALTKLRSVEMLDDPWQTEPHAPQRCVKHIEVEADGYRDDEPQNGQ